MLLRGGREGVEGPPPEARDKRLRQGWRAEESRRKGYGGCPLLGKDRAIALPSERIGRLPSPLLANYTTPITGPQPRTPSRPPHQKPAGRGCPCLSAAPPLYGGSRRSSSRHVLATTASSSEQEGCSEANVAGCSTMKPLRMDEDFPETGFSLPYVVIGDLMRGMCAPRWTAIAERGSVPDDASPSSSPRPARVGSTSPPIPLPTPPACLSPPSWSLLSCRRPSSFAIAAAFFFGLFSAPARPFARTPAALSSELPPPLPRPPRHVGAPRGAPRRGGRPRQRSRRRSCGGARGVCCEGATRCGCRRGAVGIGRRGCGVAGDWRGAVGQGAAAGRDGGGPQHA